MNDPWIQTYTGKKFYPLNPREEDIDIRDIAHALSLEPRWGGATEVPYSVAAHSIAVSQCVPDGHRLAALLHDASEAYLRDIPRPLKRSAIFSEYRFAEIKLQEAIERRFDVWLNSCVLDADAACARIEALTLFPSLQSGLLDTLPTTRLVGTLVDPRYYFGATAERKFLDLYKEYKR